VGTAYRCHDRRRRALAIAHERANGIDFIEVLDREAPAGSPRQRTLLVHLLKDVGDLRRDNVRIDGGVRVPRVGVSWAFRADRFSTDEEQADEEPNWLATPAERALFAGLADAGRTLVVRTDSAGDFSRYTLRLTESAEHLSPPEPFDAQLAALAFSFKVDCPNDFDCTPDEPPAPTSGDEPLIDYLAKDYDSFRRLMLDRLSVVMPTWSERHPADATVALVELLAYVGDGLSYYQDAVAGEAYLGLARRRRSVRRHARLLDYPMHDGCNARAWLTLEVGQDGDGRVLPGPSALLSPPAVQFVTRTEGPGGSLTEAGFAAALAQGAAVFEPLHALTLFRAHNEIRFHTWGDEDCRLPRGATRAALHDDVGVGGRLRLRRGDVLVLGERTALGGRARCHAVRLTHVDPEATLDEASGARTAPPARIDEISEEAYVEVAWADEDALPFSLCLSTRAVTGEAVPDVAVAWGNVVLADHGVTREERLGERLGERLDGPGGDAHLLPAGPITQQGQGPSRTGARRGPFDPTASASEATRSRPCSALPAVRVLQEGSGDTWEPRRDLLSSGRFDRHLVVEVEDDGSARLRFGDGSHGARPRDGAGLTARYRLGNGRAGNVGAGTITGVFVSAAAARNGGALDGESIVRLTNPLPAGGGEDPEPSARVKLHAPHAFRVQERAVTEADYAELAERHPEVHKARATFRWTGSWSTVFVTVDRQGGRALDADFLAAMHDHLGRYRLAGHDVRVEGPVIVGLDLGLRVCVASGSLRSDVARRVREALGSRVLRGERGFFHPDRWTFAQDVHGSELYERILRVDGVASATITTLKRFGRRPDGELESGLLATGRLEIVRLDDDANFPEHGRLTIDVTGGV
jgi:hypothetical protein